VRKLLIALLVLVGVLVVVDFVARGYAEGQAGQVLQRSLGLSKQPSVSLGGFPFLVHAATGSFPSVAVEASDVVAQGVKVRKVQITLRDVEFSLSSLATGSASKVSIAGGDGSAALTAGALDSILRTQDVPVTVEISGGRVSLMSDQLPGSVSATLSMDGRILVARATDGSVSYSVPLPKLVPGIRFDSVTTVDDVAVVTFRIERRTFPL
jgi:LmeA-like phospholipid-binding